MRSMPELARRARVLIALLSLTLAVAPAVSDAPARHPPEVADARDAVFAAFARHPVVALSDVHGLAQEGAFYAALVRDPRFARQVGALVVEFGDAAQQQTIDRYVNGEDVPYADLRKAWTDLVGWERPPGQMYANVFAAVRAANAGLPPARRIRVWLGEPPVDWTKIKSFDDLAPSMDQRDSYPAGIVDRILAGGGKALVIYGGMHFFSGPDGEDALKQLVERRHPRAVYVITTYAGFGRAACNQPIESRLGAPAKPVLAAPIAGGWIETALRRPDCVNAPRFVDTTAPGASGPAEAPAPPPLSAGMRAKLAEAASGVRADALLYLGPASRLTRTPDLPDLYLDGAFAREMRRREELIGLPPAPATAALDRNTQAPQAYHPD